jgi:UDP-GlcNAc:undecaprenyl-phosphate GlcNAc-1-phosphate transferase
MLLITGLCLVGGLLLSLFLTRVVRTASEKAAAFDTQGVAGQVKAAARRVANTGGIGIFWSFAIPLLAVMIAGLSIDANTAAGLVPASFKNAVLSQWPSLQSRVPMGLIVLASALALHILGVIDDRKPLGPFFKLFLMVLPAVIVPLTTDTRLLTLLDGYVGGPWASIVLTAIWIIVVTNAFNFLDNMDGLSGGLASMCGLALAAIAILHGQWFIAAALALLVGSTLGFLFYNRPPATIFMGDGGSLVLGFLLAVLSIRISYVGQAPTTAPVSIPWHAVLTPLVVLAIPLYDFSTVTLIRLSQGKSPFVGDLQHISHRLVRRGLTKPAAVAVIIAFAGVTSLAGIVLSSVPGWVALTLGIQVALLLIIVAAFEYSSRPREGTAEGKRS